MQYRHVFPIALLTVLLSCHPLSERDHIAKALEFRDRGDFKSSSIELKNALQQNPSNIEARRLLGEVYVKLGDGAAAEKELKRALDLGLAPEAASLTLAQALLLEEKYRAVLEDISLSGQLSPEQRARLLSYRGNARLALGQANEAKAEYQRALKLVPDLAAAKLGLAQLAWGTGDPDKASHIISEILARDPKNGLAWRLQGVIALAGNRPGKAEEAYTQAIAHNRINIGDYAQRALARIQAGKLDPAKADLKVLEKRAPHFYLTAYVGGLVAFAEKRYEQAQHRFEEALKRRPDHLRSRYYLGLAHLAQNHLEQAAAELAKVVAGAPNLVQPRLSLAIAKLRLERFEEAKRLVEPILLFFPEHPLALELMANAETGLGRQDQALTYLQRLAASHPDSARYVTKLGYGYLAGGDDEKGIEVLRNLLEQNPDDLPTAAGLAFAYLHGGRLEEARAAIAKMRALAPDSVIYYTFQGYLKLAQGDSKAATETFRRGLAAHPGDPELSHNLAQMMLRQGHDQEALDLYRQAVASHPDHLPSRLRLARLAERLGDRKTAIAQLTEAHRRHPQALEPAIALARQRIRDGQPDQAQTLLEEIQPRHPDSALVLGTLAEAQLASGQPARALETATRLTRLAPRSPRAYYLVAQAAAAGGDLGKAEDAVRQALRLDSNYLPARVALTRLLLYRGQASEARRRIGKLLAAHPRNRWVLETAGWIALGTGEAEQAVGFFQTLHEQEPSSATVANLAGAQRRAGQPERAFAILEDWNRQHPEDNRVRYLRVGFLLDEGKRQEAIRLLEEVLQRQPDHVLALNDLAWLMRETHPKRARHLIARAVELAPAATALQDTQALILLEQGRKRKALEILQAIAVRDRRPLVRLHLARALAENGATAEARNLANELLNAGGSIEEETRKLLASLK